ncbi:hypothetical protein [Actinocorallia herbida]|uniref:hypothetical protein n=1 Tax=Actinocorallia herbida TaxID=58109 RepID=UPI001B85C18F|nr:hypothetical protein [Actinocorallia herbida]
MAAAKRILQSDRAFGAGAGLGVSVVRRFGREGFRLAPVARRKDRLAALVAQLAEEDIEAVAFPVGNPCPTSDKGLMSPT